MANVQILRKNSQTFRSLLNQSHQISIIIWLSDLFAKWMAERKLTLFQGLCALQFLNREKEKKCRTLERIVVVAQCKTLLLLLVLTIISRAKKIINELLWFARYRGYFRSRNFLRFIVFINKWIVGYRDASLSTIGSSLINHFLITTSNKNKWE